MPKVSSQTLTEVKRALDQWDAEVEDSGNDHQ